MTDCRSGELCLSILDSRTLKLIGNARSERVPLLKRVGGILDYARLRQICQDRIENESRYHSYFLRLMEKFDIPILRLMKKFDISYRIGGGGTRSLVAQLVPLQRPSLPWQQASTPPAGTRTLDAAVPHARARARADPVTDRQPPPRLHRQQQAAQCLSPPPDHRLPLRSPDRTPLQHGTSLQVRAPSPDMYCGSASIITPTTTPACR
jgi:hypothetical protein